MFRKLYYELKLIFNALGKSLEDTYSVIFKGGVVLIGVSLAGLVQMYPEATKFDYEARKIQFEIEAVTGKMLNTIDCEKIKSEIAKCKLAQYETRANKSSMVFASFIIVSCAYLGFFLLYLSIQGYICKALKRRKNA